MSQPSTFAECENNLTKYGAGLLADRINAFWAARGHTVDAERYPIRGDNAWGVRSRLFNGLPRKATRRQWGVR